MRLAALLERRFRRRRAARAGCGRRRCTCGGGLSLEEIRHTDAPESDLRRWAGCASSAGLRAAACRNPRCPVAALRSLSRSARADDRISAARSPRTPPRAMRRLAHDSTSAVQCAVAANPSICERAVEDLVHSRKAGVGFALSARSDRLTGHTVDVLLRKGAPHMRGRLASNPWALPSADEDGRAQVRAAAASNPAAKPWLGKFLVDDRAEVRAAAASNPAASDVLLMLMADDADSGVRAAVAVHAATAQRVVETLAADKSLAVRRAALGRVRHAAGRHRAASSSDAEVVSVLGAAAAVARLRQSLSAACGQPPDDGEQTHGGGCRALGEAPAGGPADALVHAKRALADAVVAAATDPRGHKAPIIAWLNRHIEQMSGAVPAADAHAQTVAAGLKRLVTAGAKNWRQGGQPEVREPIVEEVVTTYRASDGSDVVFKLVRRVRSGWHVHSLSRPSCRYRQTAPMLTHLYSQRSPEPWVCWSRPIPDMRAAAEVAALWAESTVSYIATGRFAPQPDRPDVAVFEESALAAALRS